jgi:iron complex outermembrane recepter protein
VNDDLHFRAIRSTDIRAPNLQDLYATGINTYTALTDPVTHTSYQVQQLTTGSTHLTPEVATTKSAGVIFQPHQIPGLTGSVDYFNIDINNAIVTPSAQITLDQCAAANAQACSAITRGSNGLITLVRLTPLNIQSETTSGVDIALSYKLGLSSVNSNLSGQLALRALATYTMDHTVDLLGAAVQFAGTNGDWQYADPKLRMNISETYTLGSFSTSLNERYIGSGVVSNRLPVIVNNHVPAITYLDWSGSYEFKDGVQLYGVVENVFDQNPPASPSVALVPHLNLGVNDYLYDVIGRRFRMGVRVQF